MVRPVPPNSFTRHNGENAENNESIAGDDLPVESAAYMPPDISFRPRSGHEPVSRRDAGSPPPPEPEQLQRSEGASLYRGFLADEFRRRNMPPPADLLTENSAYNRLEQPTSAELMQAGSQLRVLSEEFARSPMRQWVEDHAARVPLDELDFNAFSELLYGLFQEGGVTWERVVVLFYFCADLAVRAFREKLPTQFHNIVEWSFRFFAGERMLRWIMEHGGWVKVMQKSVSQVYKLAQVGLLLMGACALAAYFWRSE